MWGFLLLVVICKLLWQRQLASKSFETTALEAEDAYCRGIGKIKSSSEFTLEAKFVRDLLEAMCIRSGQTLG
jgi:hypothetical protein